MTEELNLLYVGQRHLGYGRAGVDLAKALTKQGVRIYDDQGDPPMALHQSSGDQLVARQGRSTPPKPTRCICWVSVPSHVGWWWKGQHTSMLTMWEAAILPEDFRQIMHEFDQIMVPSMQNVELFSHYHPNVKYLPLGVDPEQWHYVPRADPSPTFRFLHAGSGARKGPDLAHRAFRTVFPHPEALSPSPVLVMKNPKSEEFYGPNVEMVSGRLSDDEEIALYESCHAMVMPSRGEGFGLQPLQAMAQGMPTILTNAHGHAAFADLAIPIDWSWKPAEYFVYGDAGDWWEPDFEELCEAMWDVYHNYSAHLALATASAEVIAAEWTVDIMASRFREMLPLDEPGPDTTEYHIPERRKFLVRVNKGMQCDIGGLMHRFEPGKDYWQNADVKRLLFEGGNLDVSCLPKNNDDPTVDSGLSPRQLGRVEDYAAEHAWCPSCRQRLNTQPTKADAIEAEMSHA